MLLPTRKRRSIVWVQCSRSFIMITVANKVVCFAALLFIVQAVANAQDSRAGLKPGFMDAGVAARNMELVQSLPKPDGFFDPQTPARTPTPPEPDPKAPAPPPQQPAGTPPAPAPSGLNFANSDLAFTKDHLIMGNFHGFNTYSIEDAGKARLVGSVVCPGGQGDVSVYGNLLFMSVEQTRGRLDCGTQGVEAPVSAERFRGVRIFDISDLLHPKQIAAVQTCRGSHTHTMVTDAKDKANLYIYVQGTAQVRPGEELAGCSGNDPEKDPGAATFRVNAIQDHAAATEPGDLANWP